MTNRQVRLNEDERAICRVRYRQVATYMNPGPVTVKSKYDDICKAIEGHWKGGGDKLQHGSEYSSLLFPFGNKRAVYRHINKGEKTVSEDEAIAMEWVESQPKVHREELMALLGLLDKGGETAAASHGPKKVFKAEVKDEPTDAKIQRGYNDAEEKKPILTKRERSAVSEEDSKRDVRSKRPRKTSQQSNTTVKQEEGVVKSEM